MNEGVILDTALETQINTSGWRYCRPTWLGVSFYWMLWEHAILKACMWNWKLAFYSGFEYLQYSTCALDTHRIKQRQGSQKNSQTLYCVCTDANHISSLYCHSAHPNKPKKKKALNPTSQSLWYYYVFLISTTPCSPLLAHHVYRVWVMADVPTCCMLNRILIYQDFG